MVSVEAANRRRYFTKNARRLFSTAWSGEMKFFRPTPEHVLLARRLAAAAVRRDPDAVRGAVMLAAQIIGSRVKTVLERLVERDVVLIGLGGDFEEFSVPLIETISLSRYSLGCLWPERARGDDARARETIFFPQSYFERPLSSPGVVVLMQSIIQEAHPTMAVIERVRELVGPDVHILLLSAAARADALDGVPDRSLVQGWSELEIGSDILPEFDLDFWEATSLLDQRELKILPPMTRWLLNRMNWYDLELKKSQETAVSPLQDAELGDAPETTESDESKGYKFVPGKGWVEDDG